MVARCALLRSGERTRSPWLAAAGYLRAREVSLLCFSSGPQSLADGASRPSGKSCPGGADCLPSRRDEQRLGGSRARCPRVPHSADRHRSCPDHLTLLRRQQGTPGNKAVNKWIRGADGRESGCPSSRGNHASSPLRAFHTSFHRRPRPGGRLLPRGCEDGTVSWFGEI